MGTEHKRMKMLNMIYRADKKGVDILYDKIFGSKKIRKPDVVKAFKDTVNMIEDEEDLDVFTAALLAAVCSGMVNSLFEEGK